MSLSAFRFPGWIARQPFSFRSLSSSSTIKWGNDGGRTPPGEAGDCRIGVAKVIRARIRDPRKILSEPREIDNEVLGTHAFTFINATAFSSPESTVSFLDNIETGRVYVISKDSFQHLASRGALQIGDGQAPTTLPDAVNSTVPSGLMPNAREHGASALELRNSSQLPSLALAEVGRAMQQENKDTYAPPKDLPGVNEDGTVADVETTVVPSAEKALLNAVRNGSVAEIEDCLRHGVNVNVHDPTHGGTPLHVIAGNSRLSAKEQVYVVGRLCDSGADINAPATNGSTPLHWAAGAGLAAVVEELLKRGANIGAKTYTWTRQVFGKGSGQTALHWAAEAGHTDIVERLISVSELAVAAIDERGQTPKDLAKKELHFFLAGMLGELEKKEYVFVEFETELVAHKPL